MKYISYAVMLFLLLSLVTTGCSSKKEATNNQETGITETVEKTETIEETEEDDEYGHSEEDDDNYEIDFNVKDGDDGSVSVKSGTKAEWPKDIPSFFPKLKGKIVGVIEASEDDMVSYTVMFDDIKTKSMDEFVKQVEAKQGWTVLLKNEDEDLWMIMAMNEKQDARITVTVEEGLSGGMSISFSK